MQANSKVAKAALIASDTHDAASQINGYNANNLAVTLRKFFLGTASSLVFVSAITSATSGSAQSYPRVSSPSERAETRNLNLQALHGINLPPSVEDQARYDAARAEYDVQQAQYNARVQDYEAQRRISEQQRENFSSQTDPDAGRGGGYTAQTDTYEDQALQEGPESEDEAASGAAATEAFDDLTSLDSLPDANRDLFNMRVEDIDGFTVGRFRRVEIRDNGDRMAVITLNSNSTIAIFAEDVRYDPQSQTLVTVLSINELDLIPPG